MFCLLILFSQRIRYILLLYTQEITGFRFVHDEDQLICSFADKTGTHKGAVLLFLVPYEVWVDAIVDYDLEERLHKKNIIPKNFLDVLKLPTNYRCQFNVGDIVSYQMADRIYHGEVTDIDPHEYAPQLSPEVKVKIWKDDHWFDIGYKHVIELKPGKVKDFWETSTELMILHSVKRAKVKFHTPTKHIAFNIGINSARMYCLFVCK